MKPVRDAASDLIPAVRLALIRERLSQRGAASIHELAHAFGVSPSTIRRDLAMLDADGRLERTHGGAVMPRTSLATFEQQTDAAARSALAQKRAIGREAARRLVDGGSVVLDASSTVDEAARALVDRQLRLTVVTNSMRAAQICGAADVMRVIVVGGTLRPASATLWGEPGEGFLSSVTADLCLLGAHAITGLLVTESSLEGAEIKRALMRAARSTILLADSSKFQQRAFCAVCTLAEFAEVITDDGIGAEALRTLTEAKVAVTRVRPD